MKPALLDRRVPGGQRHIGRQTIMSSKVVLEKRRPDTVISECRVRRRDASEKRGLAGLAKVLWERASGSADRLVRLDRHGFPAARTFDAIVRPAERHAPIVDCDQPAVRDGNGLHLAWGQLPATFFATRAAGVGPGLPALALAQVGGCLRYAGRDENAVATAGHDPYPSPAVHRGIRVCPQSALMFAARITRPYSSYFPRR